MRATCSISDFLWPEPGRASYSQSGRRLVPLKWKIFTGCYNSQKIKNCELCPANDERRAEAEICTSKDEARLQFALPCT